jgi:hypothetical protein
VTPRRAVALAAAVLAVATAIAAIAATRFLPALNEPSPLADEPPILAPAQPRLARRAVLVLVDGLRLDASYGTALDELRRRGVDARLRAPFPTLSKPNHVTLATGVPPRWSGIRTNDASRRVAFDSLPARAHAAGLRTAYVSDRSHVLPSLLGDGAFDEVAVTGTELEARFAQALAHADLVILVLMAVDRAGHRYGGASSAYRETARAELERLGRMLGQLDLAADAVAIATDHGHSDRGGHGGTGDAVDEVPLVLAGAGVRAGAAITGELADVAPTVAALLGVPAPGHASGRVLADALALTASRRDALARADEQRRARLEQIQRAAGERDADHHGSVRAVRLPLAAILFGGLGYLAVLVRRGARGVRGGGAGADGARGARGVPARALAAAPVFALVYWGLLLLARDPGIPGDRLSLWLEHAGYGAIAAAAHLLAYAAATRRVVGPAPAPAVALAGLAAIAAPALVAWALVGQTLATTLPGPSLVMAPPLAYAGVAFYAAAAAGAFAIDALWRARSRRIGA